MNHQQIAFTLNDAPITVPADPTQPLLDLLRAELDLTGTKKGCDYEGQCGACTVVVAGRAVRACLTPLRKVDGRQVITIEGLAVNGHLDPLQQAFVDHGAVQCGYCTPGMVMSAWALLRRNPAPARADVLRALQGNLCRCTGYVKIVAAVLAAARGGAPAPAQPPGAIGGDLRRQDAVGKVTGATRYAGDRKLPGMLQARVLRSTQAHADIARLDIRSARAMPGVRGVFTAADVPGVQAFADVLDAAETVDSRRAREPVLAIDRVRYVGEPIALVVADDEQTAQAGVDAIEVVYQPCEPVLEPQAALHASAERLHPGGNAYETGQIATGEVVAAEQDAEVFVETCIGMPSQDHLTLEPESMLAYVDEAGRVVVVGPTQQPHTRREQIAAMLAIDREQVRVIVPEMGGSFGGRHYFWPVVAIALPAFHLRQPVRLVFTRREALAGTLKRHPFKFEYRISARRDGTLVSLRARAVGDAGPYGGAPGIGPLVAQGGIGAYKWSSIDYRWQVAHTNGANSGPFRGYGMPQGALALESCLDELAARLEIDPLDLRLRNAVDEESGGAPNRGFDEPFEFKRVLETMRPHWESLRAATDELRSQQTGPEQHGVGLAAAWYRFSKAGAERVSARAGLDRNGQITLYYTTVKSGQGLDTVMSQLASHELGVPRVAIALVNGDTDSAPDSRVYGGSRSAYWVGGAIQRAVRALRLAILGTAAEMLDVAPQRLQLTGTAVHAIDDRARAVSLRAVAAEWQRAGRPLAFTGTFALDGRRPQAERGEPLSHYVVGVSLAQVRVNTSSGKVKVLQVIVGQDVGRAINPVDLEGQIEGAVVMELGAMLMEEYVPGETLDLKRYRIPRVGDVPHIKVALVESGGKNGPLGAKGVGEAVVGHARAAIANAIFDATGVRLCQIPATPARMRVALLQVAVDRTD